MPTVFNWHANYHATVNNEEGLSKHVIFLIRSNIVENQFSGNIIFSRTGRQALSHDMRIFLLLTMKNK